MTEFGAYVGLDVHKDTIAVAVALPGREEAVYRGEIKHHRKSLLGLIRSLSPHGEVVSFCYEAGPCGYGVYREIIETGHHCEVVAPSLIPRRAGERVKTDRRDALMLARLHRSGELTAVWVPDEDQEAMRDLTRAREDMKSLELKVRQRLGAFMLRHGRVYRGGKSRWTQQHFRWLEEQKFEHPVQQVVLQEYVDTVTEARRRVVGLEGQMREALGRWSLRPVVEGLMALRGVDVVTAMTVLAEVGDASSSLRSRARSSALPNRAFSRVRESTSRQRTLPPRPPAPAPAPRGPLPVRTDTASREARTPMPPWRATTARLRPRPASASPRNPHRASSCARR